MSDSSSALPPAPAKAAPLFQEKLWPAVWIWIVVLGLSAAGIFIFAPISITAGVVAAIILAITMTVLLILTTPRIVVTERTLQVGRATIDRQHVGMVEAFRDSEATEQRGPQLHGLAYLCIRGWVGPVVRIEITDDSDPTPYWLASTRHPDQLSAALLTPAKA